MLLSGFLAVLLGSSGLAMATTLSLIVGVGEEVTHPITLTVEDRVRIRFTVVGQTENTIDFSLAFPNSTVKAFGEIGMLSYSFICSTEGEYTLRFVNNHPSQGRLVTLDYEVEHYVLGVPKMFMLAVVVAVICAIIIVVFILMCRPA